MNDVAGAWSIRIYALRHFAVVLGDAPIERGRKPQRRVLDLLKAIIASGGERVRSQVLIDSLWPDAEGAAGRDAFEITLHRLRKLLRRDDAVLLEQGRASLNPDIVWVDALAFDELYTSAEPQATAPTAELQMRAITRALELYRAPFLAYEDEQPWMLTMRERLRSRHRRLCLQAAGLWSTDRAIDLLQRALEIDPTAEALYRRLMRLLTDTGRAGEAIDVYHRCARMLAATFGAKPSRETEVLFQELGRRHSI